MTRNIYLGTDLVPLALVGSPSDGPAATATLWQGVQNTEFPPRAKELADEIRALSPPLVALQEVTLYRAAISYFGNNDHPTECDRTGLSRSC